jgi:hypothetical protein
MGLPLDVRARIAGLSRQQCLDVAAQLELQARWVRLHAHCSQCGPQVTPPPLRRDPQN